jgi:hypothetical protein
MSGVGLSGGSFQALVIACGEGLRPQRGARQKTKQKLSPQFWVFGIFEGVLSHRQMTPRPVQHGGGVESVTVLKSTRTAVSASRENRLWRSLLRGETRRHNL